MKKIYLLRHGQTDWNLEGRYQGQTDIPLNETGRAQAAELARKMKDTGASAIYSSDLDRAKETASFVAKELDLEVVEIPEIKEVNQGKWEGMLYKDIQTEYSEIFESRKKDPMNIAPPEGESVKVFLDRILKGFEKILGNHKSGDTIIVVSHGFTTAVAKAHFLELDFMNVWDYIPHNTDITLVEV